MPGPPMPPIEMPPARTVNVPGSGELFLRDTGGDGPVVMLLHGWVANADINWRAAYGDLAAAGYRVLAVDHRGHGRGLRPLVPFRLLDCAGDAAGALRELEAAPAVLVGYSMGGAIAQLIARDHRDVVSGLVLSGTAQHWQDARTKRYWRLMGGLGVALALAPKATWARGLRSLGIADDPDTAWLRSELLRNSARDIAEAGRELGRFDSRPWLASIDVPAAVVITTEDLAVPPPRQRELARAANAEEFDVPLDHLELVVRPGGYNPALLAAIAYVREREPEPPALPDRHSIG